MTGAACLLGCSNASASAARIESPGASAIAGRSCHSAAHHCCAKKSPPSIDSAIQSLHVSGLEIFDGSRDERLSAFGYWERRRCEDKSRRQGRESDFSPGTTQVREGSSL